MYVKQSYNDLFSFLCTRVYFVDTLNIDTVEDILKSNEDMYLSYLELQDVNKRRLVNDVKNSCAYY